MLTKKKKLFEKNINVGIELLRFILCLWIVIIHCSNIKKEHKKYFERGFHVPTFFFISFYFYYPIIKDRKIIKIKSRFQRLLYPYFFWPILILILNNILLKVLLLGQFKKKLSVIDFSIQIITGARYHVIFWFQFCLIFISLSLTIISFLYKKNLLLILQFLGVISLYFHFSGTNLHFFSRFRKGIQITLGSLIELLPLAIVGCSFNSINILKKIQYFPPHFNFFLFFFICFIFKYNIFIFYPGFMYPNVLLNILSSIILTLFYSSLYLEKILILKTIILAITKFTGGIYYIHPIIRTYLQNYILYFQKKTYFSSFIIYFICYIICFGGNKLFQNNKFKYLFI